jgi:hypothetical protein
MSDEKRIARLVEITQSAERTAMAVEAMLALTPDELDIALRDLRAERCLACGSHRLPCYCQHDE